MHAHTNTHIVHLESSINLTSVFLDSQEKLDSWRELHALEERTKLRSERETLL